MHLNRSSIEIYSFILEEFQTSSEELEIPPDREEVWITHLHPQTSIAERKYRNKSRLYPFSTKDQTVSYARPRKHRILVLI